MSTIERSLQVHVPVATAYGWWATFERYSAFMDGIEVRSVGGRRLIWRARVNGRTREWDAEVVELRPDERIAWRSTSGLKHAGSVTFRAIDDDTTLVTFRQDVDVTALAAGAVDPYRQLERRTQRDLERFARLAESEPLASPAQHAAA